MVLIYIKFQYLVYRGFVLETEHTPRLMLISKLVDFLKRNIDYFLGHIQLWGESIHR